MSIPIKLEGNLLMQRDTSNLIGLIKLDVPALQNVQGTKVKSCYNPLRLGTVIVLVSSGIDFVNTPHLYSDRATR